MNNIIVIGSMNMDIVVETERYPQRGETVEGIGFQELPGGKGANQALTIAELGERPTFISACGKDKYGEILKKKLKNNGVDITNIYNLNKKTGVAFINVERTGDNKIIIIPGTNKALTPEMIDQNIDKIRNANFILLQMEILKKTIIHAINLANKYNTKVILDPSPPQKLPVSIYQKIDYILPNEVELELLCSEYGIDSLKEGINYLLKTGIKNILLTQGEKGVTHFTKHTKKKYNAEKTKVVDTTGAGDAFAGSIAYGLNQGWEIGKIIKFANRVAGIVVSEIGAQSALNNIKNKLTNKY